jgi:hypothetical protein
MSDGAEKSDPSASDASSDTQTENSLPKRAFPGEDGPGVVGLRLSRIKGHISDLGTDKALPREERDLLRSYYTREREKFQFRLGVLGETEKIKAIESTIEKARKDVNSPRSEEEYSLAEEALVKARSELQKTSLAVDHLSREDAEWEQQRISARRWELSRKWEAITPDELRPAVEAIRHTFEHYGCWQSKQSTMKLCFAALHPASPNDLGRADVHNLDPYRRFLVSLLGREVERALLGANHPAPFIFKSYLDVLETALKIAVRKSFENTFKIAKAQTDLVGMHPVEWAKRHMEILVAAQKAGIRVWIKEVCDPPDLSRRLTEDALLWGSWRAPRFIHMKPAGNTPYEHPSAWTREELVTSEEILEARAEFLTDFLRIYLDEVARAAHVEFAQQDRAGARVPSQKDGITRIPNGNTPPQFQGAQAPDVWRSLHETFRALAEEELRLAPHNAGDRWLHAHVDYTDRTIECGLWHVSDGVNESFHERFEVEATRAAIALRSTVLGKPGDVWLHHVFLDLLGHQSKLLFAATNEGGIVLRVCEASAIYCARLEKQALVDGTSSAASAVQDSVTAPPSSTKAVVSRMDTTANDPRAETLREAVIKKVQSPDKYSILSIREAALYFEVRPRTIYRWSTQRDLLPGGRRGSITIESVLKFEKKRARKRRDR